MSRSSFEWERKRMKFLLTIQSITNKQMKKGIFFLQNYNCNKMRLIFLIVKKKGCEKRKKDDWTRLDWTIIIIKNIYFLNRFVTSLVLINFFFASQCRLMSLNWNRTNKNRQNFFFLKNPFGRLFKILVNNCFVLINKWTYGKSKIC